LLWNAIAEAWAQVLHNSSSEGLELDMNESRIFHRLVDGERRKSVNEIV
jgi:hypothetical protein